jgi:uncharacterized protein
MRHRCMPTSGFLFMLAFIASIARADSIARYLPVADNYILPGYQRLAETTRVLDARAAAFCTAPAQTALEQLRQSFNDAMDAWQAIQIIRFGPVTYVTRDARFELWPDKRGSVARHVRELLASRDAQALEPDRFTGGSVAVQGFSALELLLFDLYAKPADFNGDSGAYACALLMAITSNLARMSMDLVADWSRGNDAFRRQVATAPAGNSVFEDERALGGELLNNLRATLEGIAVRKLARPLGAGIGEARPKRAESWRSRRSTRNIEVNLEGARQLYRTAFAPRLSGTPLDADIESGFAEALAAARTTGVPLSEAVADPAVRPRVEALLARVAELEEVIASRAAEALDLPLGFNSLDGD